MEYLSAIFGWGSPIGIGVFMALLGVFLVSFAKFVQTLTNVDQQTKSKK